MDVLDDVGDCVDVFVFVVDFVFVGDGDLLGDGEIEFVVVVVFVFVEEGEFVWVGVELLVLVIDLDGVRESISLVLLGVFVLLLDDVFVLEFVLGGLFVVVGEIDGV